MKMYTRLFALLLMLNFQFAGAQTKEKAIVADMEYVSAHWDEQTGASMIFMRNSKGEIQQFVFSPGDKTKKEEILISKAEKKTGSGITDLSVSNLIGKKIKVTYVPSENIDPANSACCFKILEAIPY